MKTFIDVCGVSFNLREVESNSRGDGSMGRCDIKMAEISISKDMPDEIKDQTLVHEWLHGVLETNGLPEQSGNEVLVCVLAAELYRKGFRIKKICTKL